MQFEIQGAGTTPDAGAIERAIQGVDPAALVDVGPAGTLRVSAAIGAVELAALISAAGHEIAPHQLRPVKSECCGGCGG
jgi:hypothetical protein